MLTESARGVPTMGTGEGRGGEHRLDARMFGTWLVRHGLIRGAMKIAARVGDLHARLSYDRGARLDPYPTYAQMRADGTGMYRGALTVVTASHDAASQILRNDAMKVGFDDPAVPWMVRKTLTRGRNSTLIGPIDYPSLLAVNPPEHTMLRRQVSKVFTPRNIGRLDEHIKQACTSLLDDIEKNHDGGTIDVVDNYSGLLPVMIVCDIFGIPNDMRYQFLAWGNAGASSLDAGLDYRTYLACEKGVQELNTWMFRHIRHLRDNPDDSLLSQLVHTEDAGNKLTDTQIMATVSLTLAAGFETTVNMITWGSYLLATHPEARRALAADPGLWANAIEEILRFEAPVQETMRLATRSIDVNGFKLRKGDVIGVMLGAANRDPAVFENPDRFDIHRENAREHLTFSAGVHFCIGSVLARAEGRIALQTLFERYPDLTVDGPPVFRNTRTLRGFRHLPVRVRRAAGAAASGEDLVQQVGLAS